MKGILEEVLCHELAHVAVYRLHGRSVRPHGPEWKRLVRQVGFGAATHVQGDRRVWPSSMRRGKQDWGKRGSLSPG
jgi:predicted SprT family Zn-dependent metalloprotease